MSYHDYTESRRIDAEGYPFYALIMAAMRQADSINSSKLRLVFPEIHSELQTRYDAPGGFIAGEEGLTHVTALREKLDAIKGAHYGDTNRDASPGEHAEDSLGEGLAEDTVQPVQE